VLSVLKGYLAVAVPFGDQSASLARVGYERVETIVELVEVPVPAKRAVKKATAKKATAKKATAPRKSPVKKAGN
jgi:topoisomerase IA-like protein